MKDKTKQNVVKMVVKSDCEKGDGETVKVEDILESLGNWILNYE